MTTLADRLEFIRSQRKMTKTQMASAAGASSTAYAKWLRGGGIEFDYVVKLSKSLNVSLDWLASGGPLANLQSTANIPIVGNVSTGPDKIWLESGKITPSITECVSHVSSSHSAYALKITDTSLSPRALPGEALIIETELEPEPGSEVLVIKKDGTTMVRTLSSVRNGDMLFLRYDEPGTRDILNSDDVQSIHLIVAIAHAHQIQKMI